MRQKLKSPRGMTLIELVAALAVSCIVLAGITGIFGFALGMQAKSSDMYASKSIASTILARAQRELRFASNVSFSAGTRSMSASGGAFIIKDGASTVLTFPTATSGLKGYYCMVAFAATSTTVGLVTVTVAVYKGSPTGDKLYEASTSVLLNNNPTPIPGGSGTCIYYTPGS